MIITFLTISEICYATKIKFLSTKFNEVNVRNGPGLNHLLKYKILVEGYPLRVIDEFENWKKIEDFDGKIGWVSTSQLSIKKSIITLADKIYLYKFPSLNSKKIAIVEKNKVMNFIKEKGEWLLVESNNIKGWIKKDGTWGLN